MWVSISATFYGASSVLWLTNSDLQGQWLTAWHNLLTLWLDHSRLVSAHENCSRHGWKNINIDSQMLWSFKAMSNISNIWQLFCIMWAIIWVTHWKSPFDRIFFPAVILQFRVCGWHVQNGVLWHVMYIWTHTFGIKTEQECLTPLLISKSLLTSILTQLLCPFW